mmetsp:Transcript_27798/g.73473  ORF Transcript_27798/g.73473 Transcript_27798/m.73473 type:complete len:1140 (-) Transcript_27798:38-3457(-)
MALELASIQGVAELLRAVQNPDTVVRQAGEKKLDEALAGNPNELVRQLAQVLAAKDAVGVELRQEAAVLLRQCTAGGGARTSVWADLDQTTQNGLKTQLLVTIQQDPSNPVRRNAGSAVAAIAEISGEDMEELAKVWPELLPALSRFVSPESEPATRVTALGVLKELAAIVGEGLCAQGAQVVGLLQACLTDATPEVRGASAQLVLQMIEDLEPSTAEVLAPTMVGVIAVIQDFGSNVAHEELLKEVLESLISSVDEEPEFFKGNGLQQLWPMLLALCRMQHFGDEDVRHSAMEALMSFASAFAEDFCKPEGLPFMEQIVALNLEWMLEVEEDVEAWTGQADEDDDEELDGDAVQIGEENLDRLAEKCAEEKQLEDVFMPCLFKVIRAALAAPACSWKHARGCVMAVSQVVEHIEEEAWIDQCVDFVVQQLANPHPRVRYSAFQAIGQIAYDHEPYVQESHYETILPGIVAGLDDANIRVATNAANSFVSFGEELDRDVLEPHLDELMTKLFMRLQQGQTRTMQEQCLAGIAVVGEVAEELFVPYYSQVMPVLKQIIEKATGESERVLRGKAFECVSLVGDAVGKETFLKDAHEVMHAMVQFTQKGFAPDDPTREYMHEAAGRIATTLGRDFKPYVSALLPGIFGVLSQRPTEVDPESLPEDEDDDKEDMSLLVVGDKVLGLKTTVLEEMKEALVLVATLISALEDDFAEFLPATCQALLPLLEFQLSEDVREKAFKTWEVIAESARNSAEAGKCDSKLVAELVGTFLKATVGLMAKAPQGEALDDDALSALQAQAMGTSGVIRKAGKGILGKDDVAGLVKVIVELLTRLSVGKDEPAEAAGKKGKSKKESRGDEDDEESDAEDGYVTKQSVRFCLADVAGSMMRSNRADFAETGQPIFMELVKQFILPAASNGDRSLAFYICDDLVECLGELSVPSWNVFMEAACLSITHACPAVRQYACCTVGSAAKQPIFSQIAAVAAQQLGKVLQKHGERHRRRRAQTSEAKQTALSVDAAIRALGMICEYQEANVGGDSTQAWRLWLQSLPLRYDEDEGAKAHAQLLELVVKSHPVVTAPEQLPRVLGIFADIYRTRFSNPVLDKEIAGAVARAGSGSVVRFAAELPERQQKKVEQMLKEGGGA